MSDQNDDKKKNKGKKVEHEIIHGASPPDKDKENKNSEKSRSENNK